MLEKLTNELAELTAEATRLADAINQATLARDNARTDAENKKRAEESAFTLVNEARMTLFTARNEVSVAAERLSLSVRRETELTARITVGSASIETRKLLLRSAPQR